MREIKFRVWNKVKNQMEESAYSKLLVQPSGSVCIQQDDNTLADVSHDYELMQFTGLYDKNGKEIYEGDIVQEYDRDGNKRGIPYAITWDEYQSCHECNIGCGFNTGGLYYFFDGKTPTGTSEIIGNIYQNPELLK